VIPSAGMSDTYRAPPPLTCPLCGCTDFVDGELRASGLTFVADDASLLQRAFAMGWTLRARKCARCDNLQIFAVPG